MDMAIGGVQNANVVQAVSSINSRQASNDEAANAQEDNAILKAVYISPTVQIDPKSKMAVLIFRDTETGKVKDKFSMDMGIKAKTPDDVKLAPAKDKNTDNSRNVGQYKKAEEAGDAANEQKSDPVKLKDTVS